MSDNHEWISKSGRPWSLRVKSDLCAKCGTTPDAHPARSTPAEALDKRRLWEACESVALYLGDETIDAIAAEYARLSPHNREADHE